MGSLRALLWIALVVFFPMQTKPVIVVTIYPIADLVKELVGDAATVYSITPKGVRVHDYVVTSEDVERTREADAFIAVGAEEFLPELPVPEDSLFIADHADEFRINSSRGLHGLRFYAPNLERLAFLIADYIGERLPRLNQTVHENAEEYANRLREFVDSLADLPKGSVVASFPLVAYMCLTFNVTPLGPIMPGGKRVSSDRPIVSFSESKGTPVDDAVLGLAAENDVPVFYVEAFSDDPLGELVRAAPAIVGASVADYSMPQARSGNSYAYYVLSGLLVTCLLYLAARDLYARGTKKRTPKA